MPPLALHPSTEPGSLSPQWAAGRPWVLTWVLRPVLSVPTAPLSPGASCTHTLPCDTSPVEVTSSSPAPRASSGPSSQLHGIPRRGEGYSQIHSAMRRQRRGRAGGGGERSQTRGTCAAVLENPDTQVLSGRLGVKVSGRAGGGGREPQASAAGEGRALRMRLPLTVQHPRPFDKI